MGPTHNNQNGAGGSQKGGGVGLNHTTPGLDDRLESHSCVGSKNTKQCSIFAVQTTDSDKTISTSFWSGKLVKLIHSSIHHWFIEVTLL